MAKDWAAVRTEWKHGGGLVAAAAITQGVAITHFYTLGVFMKPLAQENGWSRADIGLVQIIYSIILVLFSPFIGALADRFGPRRLALWGAVGYCATFALYALATHDIRTWYAVAVLNGIAVLFCNAMVLALGISRRFHASLGLALATMLAGGSVYTSAFLPVLTAHVIEVAGVKAGYLVLAGLGAVLSLPMLYFFFDRSTTGQAADPASGSAPPKAESAREAVGYTAGEAFRQPRFWRLAIATLLMSGSIYPAMVHFIPIATDRGVAMETAAAAAGLIGLTSIAGRLTTGLLLDLFSGRVIGAICCVIPVAAFLLIKGGSSIPAVIASALIIGLTIGGESDVITFLTNRYFGTRNYALILSVPFSMSAIGSAGAIYLAGLIHDSTGSYDLAMFLGIGATLTAALLLLSLGKMPVFENAEGGTASEAEDEGLALSLP